MKKLSIALAALLLTAPVFADDVKIVTEQPLTLASADTSASTNLNYAADESVARLEKEALAASDAVSAKITAKAAESVSKKAIAHVKF